MYCNGLKLGVEQEKFVQTGQGSNDTWFVEADKYSLSSVLFEGIECIVLLADKM